MTDKPNVDKDKEALLFVSDVLLNEFPNLASPKGSDMLITNPMPNPKVRVDIHIHSSFIEIIIGDLVKYDMHLPGCEIYNPEEYSEVGFYQLLTTPDYKIWHLKRVRNDDFFNLRNASLLSKIEPLNDKTLQWVLPIHNSNFVNSLKEKFLLENFAVKEKFLPENFAVNGHYLYTINGSYILKNARFVSWGKYDGEKEYGKQKYVMSIKFYDSLIERERVIGPGQWTEVDIIDK